MSTQRQVDQAATRARKVIDIGMELSTLFVIVCGHLVLCCSRCLTEVLTEMPHPIQDQETIDYSGNSITIVDYLEPLPSLESFSINYNGLREFPDFANNTQIMNISLVGNRIASIPEELLNILTNLEYLVLRRNKLSSFPDAPGLTSLKALSLGRNRFSEFPSFPHLGRTLQKLFISTNSISLLPENKLAYLRLLRTLKLNKNYVSGQVPDFRVLSNVTLIEMTGNRLTDFSAEMLCGFSKDVKLNFDENQIRWITDIYQTYTSGFVSKATIQLNSNPIVCDCKAKWLRQVEGSSNLMINNVVCDSPVDKKGKDIKNISMSDLNCGKLFMHAYMFALKG